MLQKFENDDDKDLVQNFINKSRSLDIEVKELTKEIKKDEIMKVFKTIIKNIKR